MKRQTRMGCAKQAICLLLSKMRQYFENGPKILIITNKKLHMHMTFDDSELLGL